MHDEPTGLGAAFQSLDGKRCPACQQVKPCADFATTLGGRSSCCRACRRAAGRAASRRRAAAMRLLIALHPEEWAGLLALVSGRLAAASHAPPGGGSDG
jgi:hypothetical protein